MVTVRAYDHDVDFLRVSDFLTETYVPGERFVNWLQPRWEYMHFHPNVANAPIADIGVFERAGQIVGVVHPEHSPSSFFVQVRPGHEDLKGPMVEYAESRFGGFSKKLQREVLGLYVSDFDAELRDIVLSRGFSPTGSVFGESLFKGAPPDVPTVAEGFRLQSLADENDLEQVNAVLWRGFGHPGPPPAEGLAGRRAIQDAPGFRKDLTIVAVDPAGRYASYCGMWHHKANHVAYLEPMATDPDYRRLGLGAAVVLESVRRVLADGAEAVWVGSDQEFYKAIGFEVQFTSESWVKYLDA